MKHTSYRITVLNWEKHNPGAEKRRLYKYFKFHNQFFQDPSIAKLKQNEVILFIYCLCVASESNSSSFELHHKLMPNSLRIGAKSLQNAIDSLESFQLVRAEKIQPLFNRIKVNRIKVKETKVNIRATEPKEPEPDQPGLLPEPETLAAQPPHAPTGLISPLAEIWNTNVPELPPVKKMNPQRSKFCKAALVAWTLEELNSLAQSVSRSDFLSGRAEGTWKASFDWFIKPGNLIKISEGNYENHKGPRKRRLTNSELNAQSLMEMHQKYSKPEEERDVSDQNPNC